MDGRQCVLRKLEAAFQHNDTLYPTSLSPSQGLDRPHDHLMIDLNTSGSLQT